jgi:hypothetical protein
MMLGATGVRGFGSFPAEVSLAKPGGKGRFRDPREVSIS